MYILDYDIIRKVMKLQSGSVTKYCNDFGINRITEKKWSEGQSCMRVMQLVDFCNRNRVSPAWIIHPSGSTLSESELLLANYRDWTPVRFDADLMCSLFDTYYGSSIGSNLSDLSRWADTTPQSVNAWFHGTAANNKEPNMNIFQFLRICNHYHINPSIVLQCACLPIMDEWQPVQYSIQLQRKLISDASLKQADDSRMIYRLRYELTRTYNRFKRLQESANETATDGIDGAIASVGALHESEDNWNDISDLLLDLDMNKNSIG